MTNVPKCSSWRGHKFEARYSKGPAVLTVNMKQVYDAVGVLETFRMVTYEREVCVRCGRSIPRETAENPTNPGT